MSAIRIGLLGCGTVGGGVVRLLQDNARNLATRVGADLEVTRVLVRDPKKERVSELVKTLLTTSEDDILNDASIDVVVEVMGGVDPTRSYVERAIDSGKSVVTANKMLLALAGPQLIERAAKRGVDIAFEGAVGGGIPIVRTLRESLASDQVVELSGIVNGTCNYVLTRMRQNGLSFADAVKEAQELGYAEADPTLDVGGHDAAHKLVVLAMLAFGARVHHESVHTEGIEQIESSDHDFVARFGYAIKHLAIGKEHGDSVELRVHPALVPRDTAIANVNGVLNAVAIEGRALGPCLLSGRGAGDMPTAVSVVADLVDVARARHAGKQGNLSRAVTLRERKVTPIDDVECAHYIRFRVFDKPGILAKICGALGDAHVSIEQMVQVGGGDNQGAEADIVMTTHAANDGDVRRALEIIGKSEYAVTLPRRIRIAGGPPAKRSR
jgi:homoserine dehydrogenase